MMRPRGTLAMWVMLVLFAALLSPPPTHASAVTAGSFRMPLEGGWDVLQEFGVWNSYWSAYHRGEDVLRSYEAPVFAAGNGLVRVSSPAEVYGNVVIIEHALPSGEIVCTLYGHLKPVGLPASGSAVRKGDHIGYLSSLPAENGGFDFTHVHFGIKKGAYSSTGDYAGYGSATSRREWYDPGAFVAKRVRAAWPLAVDQFADDGMTPWLRAFWDRFCAESASL